jgi:hypothetical protein
MTAPPDDLVPEVVIGDQEDAILDLLREMQSAALVHSEATRALYRSLVQEGRLFAQTAAGRRWKERILRSALLERAVLIWQNATLWITEEPADTAAPSALIDAVAAAAMSPRRDELLDRLFKDLDDGA